MGGADVAVLVLQDERSRSLQDAGRAAGEAGRVASRLDRLAARLDADQPHRLLLDEGVEEADGVAAAADACDDGVGIAPDRGMDLRPRLAADDALELAHHERIGMRPKGRTEEVGGVVDPRDPVAHRLVDRVLEGAASGVDADDLGAEEPHPEDVELLPDHVVGAHVDAALEAEERTDRRARDAVLSRAGLRDDPPLAHALREERLAEGVVDLVGTGVGEVLALEEDPCAAHRLGEPLRFPERSRTTDELPQQAIELADEVAVVAQFEIPPLEFLEGRDKRLRHEAAAEVAEVAASIRIASPEPRLRIDGDRVHRNAPSPRIAAASAAIAV